jgi:hypothetical protein
MKIHQRKKRIEDVTRNEQLSAVTGRCDAQQKSLNLSFRRETMTANVITM